MLKKLVLFFILLMIGTSSVFALEVPPLTGPIVDQANLLDQRTKSILDQSIRELYQRENIQFQVLIIKSLEGNPIESYSIKVTDQWKLGKTREDRAALFLISLEDRKTRIEVGYGLEGDLTDLVSKRILDEVRQYFKKEDYPNGIALGLALMAKSAGAQMRFDKELAPRHQRQKSSPLTIVVMIFIFIVLSSSSTGRAFLLGSILGGSGGYRGGGGGYRGGGGWSGGGGGFGGGGASGDW